MPETMELVVSYLPFGAWVPLTAHFCLLPHHIPERGMHRTFVSFASFIPPALHTLKRFWSWENINNTWTQQLCTFRPVREWKRE